jgi:CheY-like chemotaxis protein
MEAATVLVVGNDVLVRQPLAHYLRDCGFRVLEAADDAEARAISRENPSGDLKRQVCAAPFVE